MIDTKSKILDTAQQLFGEHGYAATSLRQIIAKAGVNLAAIHYHFGSKEELLDELIARKAGPVNAERLARLDLLESGADPSALAIDQILEAFLFPMADAADHDPQFVRLMGRMLSEGLMQAIVQKHFQNVTGRFFQAVRRASPVVSDEEFRWRMQFMFGAMAHTMCGQPDFAGLGETSGSFRDRIERLIVFLTGGLRMKEK